MRFRQDSTPARPAFTLAELLVVIAITALLVGMLVPALGKARLAARTARELAAGQQVMLAYTLYADDHKSTLLPGYPPASWINPAAPTGKPALTVNDDAGAPIAIAASAQRYPWRIAPYMEHNFAALYKDERVLREYRSLSSDDYQYIVSLSPTFGLNSTFLGGDADRIGFNAIALKNFGPFYITRLDQAIRSSALVVFASGKGKVLHEEPTEGYFRVDAPYLRIRQWSDTPTWRDANATPATYGSVSYRHEGRAATLHLDSHAELSRYEQLDDMRRWSNGATGSGWSVGAR